MNEPKTQIAPQGVNASIQFILIELLEFVPGFSPAKTIVRKNAQEVTAVTFDSDDAFSLRFSDEDMLLQVIDGCAEVKIDDVLRILKTGESLIIPANSKQQITDHQAFRLILTRLCKMQEPD